MKNRTIGLFLALMAFAVTCMILSFNFEAMNLFHKSEVIDSMDEFIKDIDQSLEEGNEEKIFYIKNISDEEIESINSNIDGFFGAVKSYVVNYSYRDGTRKVTFDFIISDNYFVYNYFVKNEVIPTEKVEAIELAQKVDEIIDEIGKDNMTDYEKELAVHDYIVSHCEYEFLEEDLETYSYKAYGVLILNKGVCNGYAEAMKLLLNCLDVQCELILGRADGVSHAWNIVNLDGNWYQVDATWNDPVPDEKDRVLYTYFNITDEYMAYSHQWDKSLYSQCDSLNYNYYMLNNKYCTSYEDFKNTVLNEINENKPENLVYLVTDYDEAIYKLDFIFETGLVSTFNWQKYGDKDYVTIIINPEYL